MSKKGLETERRTASCARCGTEPLDREARYCRHCGLGLSNVCLGTECEADAPQDAAYCEMCGHGTYYLEQGAVTAWDSGFPPPASHDPYEEDDIPF